MARAFALITVLILGAVAGQPAAAQTSVSVTIDQWRTPGIGSRPHDLAIAPDGAIWYADYATNALVRFDARTEKFEQHLARIPRSSPHGLTFDSEGNLWFTAHSGNYVGKFVPGRGIIEYRMGFPIARFPLTPTFDSKGNLWFTLDEGSMVGRLNLQTEKVDFSNMPTRYSRPYDIALNSQQIPFFVEFNTNKLATVDPTTMEVREYLLPNPEIRPHRLTITTDDTIWYTDFERGYLGHFDPKTEDFEEWPSPGGPRSEPYGITNVADVVWYAESGARANNLVRFDPRTEEFQTWEVPSCRGAVRHLISSPDGTAIWFSCSFPGGIGRVRINTP